MTMSQSTGRGIRLSALLGGVSLFLLSSSAFADGYNGPFTFHLEGVSEEENKDINEEGLENAGPGVEQPAVTTLTKNGKQYVVTIWMSSMVENDPNQCKCSSIALGTDGPELVADKVLLTDNDDTDRPCNHPAAISDGSEYVVWGYGYAPNNVNTRSYVQVLNELCEPMTEPLQISQDNNNNIGAVDLSWVGEGYISAGMYNNNDQETYYRQLALQIGGGVSLEALTDSITVVDPADIGRPTIATSGDYSLLCAAKGELRPPEDGVACSYINGKTGQVMWANEEIAKSLPEQGIYFNQPSVVALGNGRFGLQVIQSTGMGKNTNVKGVSLVHFYVLQPTDTSPGVKGHYDEGLIGSYQTHSAIVAGGYGVDGVRRLGLMEAAITGNGVPLLTFIDYEAQAEKFTAMDMTMNQWVLGATVADSGHMANIYGNNPNDQGRDYMRAIGDVANPGSGMEKGFMPLVKSFFVLPYSGRKTGDYKNGLYLTFIPGATVEPVAPSTPEVVGGGEGTENPNPKPDFGQEGDPPPTKPPSSQPPGETGGPGTGALAPQAPGGCACSTENTGTGSLGGVLAALGLALLGIRRRKES
jgi:MYXO-CTERM domain-containing protein